MTRVSLARVKTAKGRMEKAMAKERKVKEKERKTGVTGSSLRILIKVLQKFRISSKSDCECNYNCTSSDLAKELNT